jgi:hypothetical protein
MRKNGVAPPVLAPIGGGAAGGGGAANMRCFNQNHMRNAFFTGFPKKYEEDIKIMQESLQDPMLDFEGRTFLDWSRHNGFKVTEAWHPLDDAHCAAADLWRDRYVEAINTL